MGLVLVAPSTRANAQATTATLVGTVTDTTGAALGRATVTIKNLSIGQSYVHQTNDSGDYEFTLLPRVCIRCRWPTRVSRPR
jgi:Carboxypeptidase regulatory-like domain